MRILLLEDEEAIRGFVRINLKRNGMDVTEAEDGETALQLAEEADPPFDAALLDVMLPTISGFEVCEALRRRFPRMGIIMLTAKSQEEDKIRGLELGADDYVQKPFSPGELIARLSALHRRMMPGGLSSHDVQPQRPTESGQFSSDGTAALASNTHEGVDRQEALGTHAPSEPATADAGRSGMPSHASADTGELSRSLATDGGAWGNGNGYAAHASPHQAEKRPSEASRSADEQHVGPFRLSTAKRRLWKSGEEVILTPTEWTLMKLLMDREGEGLSRDEILNAVWGRHFIGDLKIVDVNIRRIRQKIEATPSHPVYIETLWGYGYRFNRGDEG